MQDLSPIGWALRPLKRYAQFSGRSSRAEFWWFFLGLFLVYIAMWILFFGAVAGAIASGQANPGVGVLGALGVGGILIGLFWLALIIPTIAVQARRLHDTDRSGWWLGGFYLLYALYLVGMFSIVGSMSAAAAVDASQPALPNSNMFAGVMVFGGIMFIYMIVLLVFFCLRGTRGPNRFGDDPYGADVEQVFA